MKKILATLLLSALPVLLLAQPNQNSQPKLLVFTHVTVIDATGAPANSEMTVVINGDRISEIGKTNRVRVPKDAQVVDATGKFLIPGLWDMHVHTCGMYCAPGLQSLKLFIANGVTGVRDMGSSLEHLEQLKKWRQGMLDGTLVGPRIVMTGPVVEYVNQDWLANDRRLKRQLLLNVSSVSEARDAVRMLKQRGVDFIKVNDYLSRDAYLALADEAKKAGLPLVGHIPNSVSTVEASDAGQKSVEHLESLLLGCSANEPDVRRRRAEARTLAEYGKRTREWTLNVRDSFNEEKALALFRRFRANGTWVCPNLSLSQAAAYLDEWMARTAAQMKYVPDNIREEWDALRAQTLKSRAADGIVGRSLLLPQGLVAVKLMRQSGVGILAGTDSLKPFFIHGFSLHEELSLLVEGGLTPMEALQTATLNPAHFLGREKELGTLEKGKLADLVLLDADPLADIRNTQKIQAVVVNGRLLDRKALDELLAQAEAAAKK